MPLGWTSLALDGGRRLRATIDLLTLLQGGGRDDGELPDRARLEQVQRAAHRMGGLPALAAELVGSYTERPTPTTFDRPPDASRPGPWPRLAPWTPAQVDRVAIDLTVVRVAVPIVASGHRRARLGVDLLEQLAADTAAQRQLDVAHHDAIAACLGQVFGESAVVPTTEDSVPVTTSHRDPARLPGALVTLTLRHGVVHPRLRTSTVTDGRTWTTTRWGTARRVSPTVVDLVRELLARPRDDDRLADTWRLIGLDDELRRDLVPIVDDVLEPLDPPPDQGPDPAGLRTHPIAEVPDELGAVYAATHLIGAGRLASLVDRTAGDGKT